MSPFAYQPDQKVTDIIAAGGTNQFTLSAEVIPPRNGASPTEILNQIAALVDSGAQFLAVTKGAGGSLRGGSLPIAQLIKERFRVPCIAHFTCRDIGPAEVENQLVDHHYFGIRNILALRGDPPVGETEWTSRADSYPYAYQLIEQIKRLNAGQYLERKGYKVEARDATDFCIGAAAYPDHPAERERIGFFELKAKAGAEYGITQMLFNPESYARFIDDCGKVGVTIPVLPGTRILKSKKQAERMASRFEVDLPKDFLSRLPEDEKTATPEQILEPFMEYVDRLRGYGAPGVHLFVLSDTEISSRALRLLSGGDLTDV